MKKLYYYDTKIGKIGLAEEYGFLTNLFFKTMRQPLDCKLIKTETLDLAYTQLEEYFNGERFEFDIPINPKGTSFQQKVWCELLNIPYGEIKSYKEIATLIGNSNSVRAVGNANNKNPIPIIIPCHRVISTDGSLNKYIGGEDLKQILIDLEKENSIKFCK